MSPSVKAKLDHSRIELVRFVPIHYSLSLYLCMHAYICVYMYIHILATGPMPEASEFDQWEVMGHWPDWPMNSGAKLSFNNLQVNIGQIC